jgi:hypothetical protein
MVVAEKRPKDPKSRPVIEINCWKRSLGGYFCGRAPQYKKVLLRPCGTRLGHRP